MTQVVIGTDCTPTGNPEGDIEIHINGDIAFAGRGGTTGPLSRIGISGSVLLCYQKFDLAEITGLANA